MPVRANHPLTPIETSSLAERIEAAWFGALTDKTLRRALHAAVSTASLVALGGCERIGEANLVVGPGFQDDETLAPYVTAPDGGTELAPDLTRDDGGFDNPVANPVDGGEPLPESEVRCNTEGAFELAVDFQLSRDVDYVADRSFIEVLSSLGSPCATALDVQACMAALGVTGPGRHLLTTEGDVVRLWEGASAIALLAPIENNAEAVWAALAQGFGVHCGTPVVRIGDVTRITNVATITGCGVPFWQGTIEIDAAGTVTQREGMTINDNCAIGRRPEGLASRHVPRTRARIGEHFAAMAHMEAASVPAFRVITDELAALGAPLALIRDAESARRDEVMHTRIASALARRFGATPTHPIVRDVPRRSLEAFALDNAVEGCVFETYSALEAGYQAVTARDARVRVALRRIAQDETRHALLSWRIARWVTPKLSAQMLTEIAERQRDAVERLRTRVETPVAAELRELAGLPDVAAARALHAGLVRSMWRA